MYIIRKNYRRLIPQLLLVLSPLWINAQEDRETPSLESFELKGAVERVDTQEWSLKNADKQSFGSLTLQFNSDGFLLERKELDEEAELKEQNTFTYDERNNPIEVNYRDNYVNKANYKTVITYDEKGYLLTRVNYNPDESPAQSLELTYDGKERLITEEEILHNSESSRKTEYQYDEEGNKIEEIGFSGDWADRKQTFKYDQGILVEKKEFRNISEEEEWVLDYKTTYEYNDAGDEIKNVETGYDNADQSVLHEAIEETTYDAKGNKIEIERNIRRFDVAGRDRRELLTMDENGNRLTERTMVGDNVIRDRSMRYEYDEQGNWRSKTEFDGEGEPRFMAERTITYFER